MRRGLLAWSEEEVPRAVLDARLRRCQAALADAGMDALLLYTNFPRPAAVSFLTHFVPYWSQGVAVVLPDQAPVLFVSLSKRVGGWIEETSCVSQVICTPRLGADIAGFLAGRAGKRSKLGVLELSRFPGGIAAPLGAAALVDAAELFRSVRHPADDAEIALSGTACDIARRGFEAIGTPRSTGPLVAAIEGTARAMGAEEVQVLVAPDLAEDTRLIRPERDLALGRRFAVQVSIAYKGHWIRLTGTVPRGAPEEDDEGGLAGAFTRTWRADGFAAALQQAVPGAAVRSWRAEANLGSYPLTAIADADAIPPGSVVSVTALYDGPEGPVLAGGPALAPVKPG